MVAAQFPRSCSFAAGDTVLTNDPTCADSVSPARAATPRTTRSIDRGVNRPPPGPTNSARVRRSRRRQPQRLSPPAIPAAARQGPVERHLPIHVPLPRADDQQPLPGRDRDVVDVERDQLLQAPSRIQQQHHDRTIPRSRGLRRNSARWCFLRQRPRRRLRQRLALHIRGAQAQEPVEVIDRRERHVHRRGLPPLVDLQGPVLGSVSPGPSSGPRPRAPGRR
jgi:hypothetical protein